MEKENQSNRLRLFWSNRGQSASMTDDGHGGSIIVVTKLADGELEASLKHIPHYTPSCEYNVAALQKRIDELRKTKLGL